ncbi:piggyBac transposable element-derived protein 4 [Aplysia californica]|uniref:PiggyBac transposable element-derived protein 4 n=1 Tax=Aplysia californica TaxID=6500 RepID=A0ABM0JRE1_APLCA|nr:piggyBac transposable element-derived protein 4 [Aplysia californica]
MSSDRFDQIWRYLHLSDNTAPPSNPPDKLRKFGAVYELSGIASVDESMVKFKGCLGFRQYMPAKPTKWGIKVWATSTDSASTRKGDGVGTQEDRRKWLAYNIIMDLVRPYFATTDLQVFMDNFYSSCSLMEDLVGKEIQAAGTIRANRKGLPTEMLSRALQLQKHQYRVGQLSDLTFCNWMDTKNVLVLSNFHSPMDTGTVMRRSGNPNQRAVTVPRCPSDYQRHMKGVDQMDQIVGYYIINHMLLTADQIKKLCNYYTRAIRPNATAEDMRTAILAL